MQARPDRVRTPTLGFIGLLLALGACAPRRDEVATARPATDSATKPWTIFREIDIRPFGKVTLGAAFAQRAPTAVAVSPGMFALVSDEGKFANTDSILVRVDGENRVSALSFVYQAGTEYDTSVTQYQGLLGIPTSRAAADSAGGKIERRLGGRANALRANPFRGCRHACARGFNAARPIPLSKRPS